MAPSKLYPVTTLIASITLAAGCGGGSSDRQDKAQVVTITSASLCAHTVNQEKADNCLVEQIQEGKYETDQIVIHLSGTSPPAEDWGCPEPELTLGGPICVPNYESAYSVEWVNTKNDANGFGDPDFIGLQSDGFGFVSWRTYDFFNTTIGKGVPLEVGPNLIRITTTNSGFVGNAEITVTRIIDVIPPTLHSVVPEPDGTGSRISVYFREQIDPASLVGAISVVDVSDQLVPGTTEYDAVRLKATWQPLSTLNPGSFYTARVSGITDWAPNTMIAPYEWSFTTPP